MPESPEARERRRQRVRDYHERHKEAHNQKARDWKKANPGVAEAQTREWRATHKGYVRQWMKERREGLKGPYGPEDGPDWQERSRQFWLEKKRESTNRRRQDIKLEALAHYSNGENPRCYCCGESHPLLLGLDHINGGGTKHRKEEKISKISQWAKRNNWPPIFRVACHSCNLGSHLNGGTCPHQETKSCPT